MAQAIAEGRRPEGMVDEEEILYDFCLELQRNHSVSDATYDRAVSVGSVPLLIGSAPPWGSRPDIEPRVRRGA